MPNFRLSDEESQAIAAYLWQHADERSAYEGMPAFTTEEQLSQGNFIFEQVGCMACHTHEKDAVRGFAPNLARIGEKINYGYLVEWITNPKGERTHHAHAKLQAESGKASLVAGYLISKTGKGITKEGLSDAGWLGG